MYYSYVVLYRRYIYPARAHQKCVRVVRTYVREERKVLIPRPCRERKRVRWHSPYSPALQNCIKWYETLPMKPKEEHFMISVQKKICTKEGFFCLGPAELNSWNFIIFPNRILSSAGGCYCGYFARLDLLLQFHFLRESITENGNI